MTISSMVEYDTTDVLICGCGPTGAMLSCYLGLMSIPNVVLEKEPSITTDPRGIALDEEGIRLLQGVGIYNKIYTEIGNCMQQFQFIGGRQYDLSRKPFMLMDYGTTEGGTGHVGFICHKQPSLEKHLRDTMDSLPHSQLRSNSTVNNIHEDENWVYCQYIAEDGSLRHIRSKFLVGADGKTGFVRKYYLEPKGVKMEHTRLDYEETWVALNWRISIPTKESHPDFPLWRLGYSPEQVYRLFFPENFRFLCNPDRPAVFGNFGLEADRLWRFEFVVRRDEDPVEMASPPMIKKVVFPYLRHKGSRYGLREDVVYPEDCIEVLRCRPFGFSARCCNKWFEQRVILCGDSAHVFPPFGGQGIASGFRDTVSLAWRLAIAARQPVADRKMITNLLTGWYTERKQQLVRSLASTIENGNFVTEENPAKIFIRDWYLWFMQLVPSWRHKLQLGNRRDGMVRYQHHEGMPFIPELGGGVCFPQVYCRGLEDDVIGDVRFTDDVIWGQGQAGVFKLVVLLQHFNDLEPSLATLQDLEELSGGHLKKKDIVIIFEDSTLSLQSPEKLKTASEWLSNMYRIATAEEFANSPLCEHRPRPVGYDAFRLGKEIGRKRFVFLRPDRFVFAACNFKKEVDRVAGQVSQLLGTLNEIA